MKVLKILLLIISFLLVTSTVNAITTYGEWQNKLSSIAINNSEQVYFDYALFSINPPINYNIKIYDNAGNLIKTLIQSYSNSNFVSNRYYVTQTDYVKEGIYKIIIQGSDNRNDESSTILILQINPVIKVNNAPILNSIGNKQINEGQLLQFTITATDPDNDILTLIARNLPLGARFIDNGSGNSVFSWQTNFNDAGLYNIRFIVSDSRLTDFEDIIITVIDVFQNTPPTIVINAPIQNEIISGNYNIRWTANDIDQDPVTLDIKIEYYNYNLNNWFVLEDLQDNNDGILTWNTNQVANGNYQLRITARDNYNATAMAIVSLFAVSNIIIQNNNPIIISNPILNAFVGQLYNYDVNAFDPDNDPITYLLITFPTGMNINSNNGLISWTPNNIGNYNVIVRVNDNRGGFAQQSFIINVAQAPVPPIPPAPVPQPSKITEKHSFIISNLILKQNKNDLNIFINIINKGNNKEDIKLVIKDIFKGKVIQDNIKLDINDGTWKVMTLKNIGKGRHIIKIEATSKAFKASRYAFI